MELRAFKVFTEAEAFKLMSDSTRRRIIHLLRARDLSVSQISDELELTPQAVYHHVRLLLKGGLIEVGKEERVGHLVEAYYRAAAEVFEFTYGKGKGTEHEEAHIKEAFQILAKVGFALRADSEVVSKFVKLQRKMEPTVSTKQLEDKLSRMEGFDFLTKQTALAIAKDLMMTDKQFDEKLNTTKEARLLLKSRLADESNEER